MENSFWKAFHFTEVVSLNEKLLWKSSSYTFRTELPTGLRILLRTAGIRVSEKYYCVIDVLLHLEICFRISKSLLRHGHFCFPRIFQTFKILPKKIGKTGEKKRAWKYHGFNTKDKWWIEHQSSVLFARKTLGFFA